MKLVLDGIEQKYGDVLAVDDFHLEIKEGEFIALLGPSGCGKTTLLKTMSGLMPLHKGRIMMSQKDISQASAQSRNMALVFQNYALFPHMTVYENIAYGLKVRKLKSEIIADKVEKMMAIVHLEGLNDREIHALSGGQQQRVALARALVVEPEVLLFDEPLSNLDEKLRMDMRQEIRRIQKALGITSVYVTHDQAEALAIADRIVVMNEGKIQQIGKPDDVYFKPSNEFVATFMGKTNLLSKQEMRNDKEFQQLLTACPEVFQKVMFRPESVSINPEGNLKGRVRWVENLGNVQRITLQTENVVIIADRLNQKQKEGCVKEGGMIQFTIDLEALHFFSE